ncbi:hypothetical protein D6D22_00641 [Aureobasidium pullulans]|uniref:Uncharacterized protein n=1 Tax=Aureobasidium pullulans TaxID=5580 RepID=A0A4S8YI45_AURPU|nr:hypothetical protein D6D22_00641 [Aureobasidium pullulans]
MNGKKVDSPIESLTVLFKTNTLYKKSDSSLNNQNVLSGDSHICEHPDLNKDDLIALRLTCKAHGVHDAATKALGRYFRDITVLFTRHSFQTLVDVCEHPVFGRSVRRIMLSSIRCGRDNIHHKRVINALLVKTHPYGYNDGFPEDLRRYKAKNSATWLKTLHDVSVRIQSYNSRAQDEDVFAKRGDSLVLLVQAFQSLARLDSSTTVGLTNQECHGLGRDQSFCAEETNNEDEHGSTRWGIRRT